MDSLPGKCEINYYIKHSVDYILLSQPNIMNMDTANRHAAEAVTSFPIRKIIAYTHEKYV